MAKNVKTLSGKQSGPEGGLPAFVDTATYIYIYTHIYIYIYMYICGAKKHMPSATSAQVQATRAEHITGLVGAPC